MAADPGRSARQNTNAKQQKSGSGIASASGIAALMHPCLMPPIFGLSAIGLLAQDLPTG
jgi:hypothetical protein